MDYCCYSIKVIISSCKMNYFFIANIYTKVFIYPPIGKNHISIFRWFI